MKTNSVLKKIILVVGFLFIFPQSGFCLVYEKTSNEIFVSSSDLSNYDLSDYNTINGEYSNGDSFLGLWLFPIGYNFMEGLENFADFSNDLLLNSDNQIFIVDRVDKDFQYDIKNRFDSSFHTVVQVYPNIKYFSEMLFVSGNDFNFYSSGDLLKYSVDVNFQNFLFSCLYFFIFISAFKMGRSI